MSKKSLNKLSTTEQEQIVFEEYYRILTLLLGDSIASTILNASYETRDKIKSFRLTERFDLPIRMGTPFHTAVDGIYKELSDMDERLKIRAKNLICDVNLFPPYVEAVKAILTTVRIPFLLDNIKTNNKRHYDIIMTCINDMNHIDKALYSTYKQGEDK